MGSILDSAPLNAVSTDTDAASAPPAAPVEVLFIEGNVADSQLLIDSARPGMEVHLLDPHHDGLAQMAAILGGRSGIDAIHLVSHGSQGELYLGALTLDSANLKSHADDLAVIGSALAADGDVFLYGCNVAAGEAGAVFLDQLAQATGADVAASDDYTGSTAFGGDWVLEAQRGQVTAETAFVSPALVSYVGLLAASDQNFDSAGLSASVVSSMDVGTWTFTSIDGATGLATPSGGISGDYPPSNLTTTTGDRVFIWNLDLTGNSTAFSNFAFNSTDGTNFDLNSFSLGSFAGGSTSLSVSGWRDGSQVVSGEAVDLTSSDSAGNITYTLGGTNSNGSSGALTFGSAFDNVDEIRLSFSSPATVEIDDIDISPTASAAAISSATYNASTGVLSVTGSGMTTGDTIDPTKLTVTGSNGGTYTLTSSSVTASSATAFSITLNAADRVAVNGLWNYDGTTAVNGTTYNLSAASGWDATASALADTTNGVTVSSVATPTITSATYDASTNVLVVTGTRLVGQPGAANDITVSNLRLRGEGGTSYTLTTGNVDVTSETSFSVTLNATDEAAVERLFNRNGTTSTDISTYTLSALDYWNTDVNDGGMADSNNVVTVSNVPVPAITSATYNASTGVLAVTGTGFTTRSGTNNDIDVTRLTLSGEGGASYTLTTSDVDITNGTSFSVTLNATDRAAVNLFMNRSGTSSTSGTTYNLAAAEDWARGAATAVTVADTTGNGVTATVPAPTITSATYDASTGALVVTGTGFVSLAGSANDIDISKFSVSGDSTAYTLTSSSVDVTSATSFTVTLNSTDITALTTRLNQNGISSAGANTYNLAAAEDWASGAAAAVTVADTTGNGITVSNFVIRPTVSVDVADNALSVGETSLVTFTFSEAVTGFDNSDVSVANGTLSTVSSSDGGVTWTATLTPTASVTDATNVISVAMSGVTSVGTSTAGSGTTNSNNYAIDTLRPTLTSVTLTDTALRIGDTATVTFTFSEAVSNFTTADLTSPNGSLTSLSSSDGGTTWTATFTPSASTTAASNLFTLDLTGITDTADNAGTGTATSGNYAVDTVRPTLTSSITISDTALRIGDTATVTFTFTEAVTGFTTADLSAPSGSLSSLSSSDGGITWTATLTPSASTTDSSNVITLDYTGISDAAGNAGTGSATSGNYAVDTVRPTLASAITISDTALRIGDTATVTFTFTEAVTGFTVADLAASDGTLSSLSSSDGGITWTATLTPSASTTAATNDITLDYTGITDAAGNAGTSSATSGNYAVDTVRPTLASAITISDTALRIGDTATVTFTFTEAVTGFTVADLAASDGTLSSLSSSDGGITWTATLTPSASTTAATNDITLDLTGVTDTAGNAGTGSATSGNYAVDTVRPTFASAITISDTALRIGDTATVTFTFTEAVTGFTTADLIASNAVLSSLSSSDGGITWTATLTPNASTTAATNDITLDYTGITDAAGNAGTSSATSGNYAIDTAAPSAPTTPDMTAGTDTGTSNTDNITNTTTPTFAGTAEVGSTVTLYDTGGSNVLGSITANGAGKWIITSAALSEGAHTVTAKATDAAGNTSSASSSLSVTIDTTAPTVTAATVAFSSDSGSSTSDFVINQAAQTISGTLAANLASDETVQVSLDNGSTWLDATATVGQNTFSLSGQTLTSSDTLKVRVMDTAGNTGTVMSQAYTLDTTAPTTTISTLNFSDDTGASATDFITAAGKQDISGTLSANLASGETVQVSLDNGSTWVDASATVGQNTFSLNGQTLSGADTLKVRVVDTAGNAGTVKSQAYVLDTTAPSTTVATLAFSDDTGVSSTDFITSAAAQTISGTLSANLASGEKVQVSLDNGTTWTDTAATVGQNTFSLAGQTLTGSDTLQVRVVDAAGNPGTATSQAYVLDTTAPTNTIASVAFSKDSGVSASDFITNAASQDLSGTLTANLAADETVQISLDNGTTWIDASATPGQNSFSLTGQTLSGSDTLKVRVVDLAGNAGTIDAHDYVYDTTGPATVITKLSTTSLKAGSTANVTFTFSEKVGNFDNSDITVPNGTLSTVASSDGGLTWTATLTPTAGIEDATNVITVDQSGVTDLAGNSGVGTSNSANFKIDTLRPTVTISMSDTDLKIGDTSNVTFTFSEAVSGFTNADLLIEGGTLSAVSSANGGVTWTATFTPTSDFEDATNLITLNQAGVADAFGNAGSGTTDSGNYAVDTQRPTATITLDDTALKIGDTATVTFTFNEAVSGFTTADVTAASGTLSNLSSSNGGLTWTATLTPTADTAASTNVLTLDNTGVVDLAGNAGSGTTDSGNYAVDTARPGLASAITISDTALKIGDTATVTFTFNEAVTGFTTADVAVPNGVLSNLTSGDGGVTWTATLTPSAGITDATNTLTLDKTGVQDLAGNAGSGTTDSLNYAVDTTRPGLASSIAISDTALKIGDTATVTFTFNESVTGFTLADVTAASGKLSNLSSKDGGLTWTATLTPTASTTDAINTLTLDNTGVADLAGNAGSGTTDSPNYAIDTLRPTATVVVADTALAAGETSGVTITFGEGVTGFTTADLLADHGTVSNLASSDGGTTWTATFTPTVDVEDATNLLTLDNTGVSDLAGNAGSGTTDSNHYAIDTRLPTATITLDQVALKIGETAGVTIAFSEAVIGFSNADLTVDNGTLTAVSSSDGGLTWTATFTPDSAVTDAANAITLERGGVADAAGNAGSGISYSNTYAIDTVRPTATLSVSDTALKIGDTATVTVTFNEAVSGLTVDDLTLENGTLGTLTSGDGGLTWTGTFTPDATVEDATNVITLDPSGVTDLAGNTGSGTATSGNYAIDTVRPAATLALSDSALKAGETATVSLTFSEAVTGLTVDDLTVAHGALSALASSDGGVTWTATYTPDGDVEDATNLISLNNAGVTDVAGNAGSGTTDSDLYQIDTLLPGAAISLSDTALKIGDSATVTISFTETVAGLTLADLTAAGGVLSDLATSNGGLTWTATFTPAADTESTANVITLDTAGVTDAAGNAGSGLTDSEDYSIDTLRPTASISVSDTALKIGDTATVTLTFNEAVSGLAADDLTVAHGTLGSLTSGDGGLTWTGTFTPDAAIEDASNVLSLDQTGVTDLAGNAGSGAATSGNFAIDTVRPTATLSLSDSALQAGETATLTVTFSEAVTGLAVDDLTVAHGALSALVSADGGVTWTATYTPDSDVEDATNLITLANAGIADLAGNPGSGTTDSANFTLDTLRPTATMTLADTALKIGETTTVTFAFSEAVSGLTPDDLTVAHGTLSTPTSSDGGVTWTATFTPTADVENTGNLIRLNNAGITDAAGNPGSGTTDSNPYALDTRAPTATVTALAFSGDSGFSSSDRITRVAAQTITGRLSSPLSVGDSIQVSLDGGSTWRAAVATAGLETFSLGDVILGGSDAVQVRLVDAAGNLGAVQSIGYVLDTTPPATPRLLDLQTASDTDTGTGLATATEDNVTTLATPTFDVVLATEPGAGVNVGDTVTLTVVAANGTETALASRLLTAEDLAAGRASLTAPEQDDGTYTLRARLYDPAGNVRDFAALEVTIVTDLDGVTPSIEATARNGDFNQDGVPDSTQSNVTALPLLNAAAFAQGNQADPASFGALVVGIPAAADGSGTVTLDPAAQLAQVKVLASQDLGATFGADVAAQVAGLNVDPLMSGILDFTLKPKDSAGSLRDSDPLRPGLQTQVVLELPPGITADTYYKIGQTTADGPVGVYAFMATGENSDGARFVDLDGNGTPDRVVITFTDGALGDDDLTVNGQIRDPGFLGFAATGSGDTLRGDTTRANHFRDVLTGTDYADTISGLKRADRLYGHGGDDVLDGGRGRDRLYGDAGNDRLEGGKRGDWLYGGDGNDGLGGGRGHDRLYGEAGNDVLSGGAQQDLLIGGAGNDALAGGRGVDTYRYRAPALGQDDLAAGSHDRITEISAHNILDFDAAVESVLKFDGVALADLTQRTDVTGQIDAGSSIAFVVETGTLQIDVNGDGVFNAQQDVQIDLVGVNHVTYLPGQAAFLLSA